MDDTCRCHDTFPHQRHKDYIECLPYFTHALDGDATATHDVDADDGEFGGGWCIPGGRGALIRFRRGFIWWFRWTDGDVCASPPYRGPPYERRGRLPRQQEFDTVRFHDLSKAVPL